MAYLDETGLAYFWGKIKRKLKNKSDDDKYQIATFTTQKQIMQAEQMSSDVQPVRLDLPINNKFVETFPGGYRIACVLAADWRYYASQQDYDEDKSLGVEGARYHIGTVKTNSSSGLITQRVSVYFPEAIDIYGYSISYTLLLEKMHLEML